MPNQQDQHYQTLEITRDGMAATIWLNRAEVRNAFNETAIAEIAHAFRALDQDCWVRAVRHFAPVPI